MVDVDRRRTPSLTPAHAAGLRRLSARAATHKKAASTSHAAGIVSFSPLADSIIDHLGSTTTIDEGLSQAELAHIEATLSFAFPPDLRAILAKGMPIGPAFPNWRATNALPLDLPIASAALQVARGTLWPRSWGPRPSDPDRALRLARAALRRAPTLIPIFDRCYLPASPAIAGNPVFFVEDDRIVCCAYDLADFFNRDAAFCASAEFAMETARPAAMGTTNRRSLDNAAGRSPRWIEFWSDAASDRRRRISSSSSSSCSSDTAPSSPRMEWERFVEIRPPPRMPAWVDEYLDGIGAVLRSGGWGETEVGEMVRASPCELFDGDDLAPPPSVMDTEAVFDELFVRAERCAEALRRAGWAEDEFSDDLRFDSAEWRRRERRRSAVRLPAEIAAKMGKIVDAVSRS